MNGCPECFLWGLSRIAPPVIVVVLAVYLTRRIWRKP